MTQLKTKGVLFQVRPVLTVIKVVLNDSSIQFPMLIIPAVTGREAGTHPARVTSPSEDTHSHTHTRTQE